MKPIFYYLGHSAWAVETENRYILFDIQDTNLKLGGTLPEGFADLAMLSNKPVLVLFSHRHHDHYSRKLHTDCDSFANAHAELGGVTIRPREKRELGGGVTLYTGDSTDEGVCFLVQADGLTIFFAGDNADWADGDNNRAYYGEIDYIAALGFAVDYAFIPVCTFSGQRPGDMTRGALYAVTQLNPGVTFPMHANGREHLYAAFEKDLRSAGCPARVVCAKEPGRLAL